MVTSMSIKVRLRIGVVLVAIAKVLSSPLAQASQEESGVLVANPSVSPSEQEIAFQADFAGAIQIWVVGRDGSNLRNITPSVESAEEPAWSPDGSSVLASITSSGVTDIWSCKPDGFLRTRLTQGGSNNRQPAWTPDGQHIVFVSDRGGSNDLWMMDRSGGTPTRITRLPGLEDHPSVSPDGQQIVFTETTDSGANLKVVRIDGSGLVDVTPATPGVNDWNPRWTSKGIVFSSNRLASTGHWQPWLTLPGQSAQLLVDASALDPVMLNTGSLIFSDEFPDHPSDGALAMLTEMNPATHTKRIVIDVRGFQTPIDIRPNSKSNLVFPKSVGSLPVAILGTKTFDPVKSVDRSSIRFGKTGDENSLKTCLNHATDVNKDGYNDLVCRYTSRAAGFGKSDTVGVLRFRMMGEATIYEGRDMISTTVQEVLSDLVDSLGSPSDPVQ